MTTVGGDVADWSVSFPSHNEPTLQSEALAGCFTFRVNGCNAILGYILPEIVEKMHWSDSWVIDHQGRTVTLATPANATAEMRSCVVEETLQATRQLGTISLLKGWRGERFPVYGPDGETLLEMERCASALFGIVTYGVQLIAYVRKEQRLRLWISKRSEEKQTYAGMLDTTAAGGLVAGKLPIEGIICEAQEEASIPEDVLRQKVKPMSTLNYFHIRGEKAGGEVGLFQPEVEYTYELELDEQMVPQPKDSEVAGFKLYTIEEALNVLKEGRFKPNSAIIIVEFLITHGFLNERTEQDYADILFHLHRRLEFPLCILPPI